jgi:ribosome maturation factor RimP
MAVTDGSRREVISRVSEIAERVGAPKQIEIVDVELKGAGTKRLLRLFIDKPDGVTHGDCEFISKNVGTILDVEEVVPGASYTLEVSSPGVERPLKRAADFERFAGQKAKIFLREPVAGKRRWVGILAGISSGVIALEPAKGELIEIDLGNVEKAHLKFEW